MKDQHIRVFAGAAIFFVFFFGSFEAFTSHADMQEQIRALLFENNTLTNQVAAVAMADDYGVASSTPSVRCPAISQTIHRGAKDGKQKDVSNLQAFLADYFDVSPDQLVSGYFGRNTEKYLMRFQQEQGLPSVGIAGQLTRAVIKTMCGPVVGAPAKVATSTVQTTQSVGTSTAPATLTLTLPQNGSVYARTSSMVIHWTMSSTTHDMNVVGTVALLEPTAPFVGRVAGGVFMRTVHPGDSEGEYVWDWSNNDTLTGRYSVTLSLQECSSKGCASNGAMSGEHPAVAAKTTPSVVKVTGEYVPFVSSTTVTVLSPNGGETFVAGSGKNVTLRWSAAGVPKGATVCTMFMSETTGKLYMFPGGAGCISATNATSTRVGALVRSAGYDLAADQYRLVVSIYGPASGGKDAPLLAEDRSDQVFTLTAPTPSATSYVSPQSNLASVIAAGEEGFGVVMDALASFIINF